MSVTGTWTLAIKTPMGTQRPVARLVQDGNTITGTMNDPNVEPTPIKDGVVDGDKVSWKFDAKKPFPMTIVYTLALEGDALNGTGKAGAFPPAPVTGVRS